MYNWSTDTKILEKDPEKYAIWKLEQRINYGLDDEKLKKSELKKYFHELHIDPQKKRYLAFLLA